MVSRHGFCVPGMVNLVMVPRFKLLLRPPYLSLDQDFEMKKLRSLPKNKTVQEVFGDLMKYLFQSTKQYIMNPEKWAWTSAEGNIHFIFSHPNGWEGKQQSKMRRAAVAAGLVASDLEAEDRITFVTEGEASLHFCLDKIPNTIRDHVRNVALSQLWVLIGIGW